MQLVASASQFRGIYLPIIASRRDRHRSFHFSACRI